MNYIHNAAADLVALEMRLRGLIQDSIAASAFDQAKRLVDTVAAISQIRLSLGQVNASSEIRKAPQASVVTNDQEIAQEPVKKRTPEFPRFERDGDRLVKVGWSSKDKSTYEHRVARDVAFDVIRVLSEKIKGKKPFKMEKVFPIIVDGGEEVPGYQAYLVLKWLQHYGVVERKGNDGYIVRDAGLATESVEQLWHRTPERS